MVTPTIWIVLFHQESVSLQCYPTHQLRCGVFINPDLEFLIGMKQHNVFITKLWDVILYRISIWAAVLVDKVRVTQFYNRSLWWFVAWCHKKRKYWHLSKKGFKCAHGKKGLLEMWKNSVKLYMTTLNSKTTSFWDLWNPWQKVMAWIGWKELYVNRCMALK